jgi:hypothetical protein
VPKCRGYEVRVPGGANIDQVDMDAEQSLKFCQQAEELVIGRDARLPIEGDEQIDIALALDEAAPSSRAEHFEPLDAKSPAQNGDFVTMLMHTLREHPLSVSEQLSPR